MGAVIDNVALDDNERHRMAISSDGLIKVGVLVGSGIAINKLSDMVNASAPVIIGGSLIVLVIMLAVESQTSTGESREGLSTTATSDLVKFSLASLLLGAAMGAISVIPLVRTYSFTTPWGPDVHSYEVGTAATIVILTSIAIIRHTSLLLAAFFLISTTTGMTLSIVTFKPENNFTSTFVGWLIAEGVTTAFAYSIPDIFRLFKDFWWPTVTTKSVGPAKDACETEQMATKPT